jgi:anti-sigma regulatory factor (Ser/Thr protein kinase)
MAMSAARLPVRDPVVRVETETEAAVTVMTVRGAWDAVLCRRTTTALRDCLAGHPEALIIDLSGLDDPRTESAPTWAAAQHAAAGLEPPLQLALCVPPDLPLADRMQRLGARRHLTVYAGALRYLPVYAKVRQARVAIAGRLPSTDRVMLTVRPEPEAPSLARLLAGDACVAWDMPELLHAGRLVMSELVTNAVEHARSELTVVVTRRGEGLHLAVSDEITDPPRMIELARPRRGQPLDDRGRGLRMVDATAIAWGSLPTRTGKVVWATIQPHREARPVIAPRRRHPGTAPPYRRIRLTELR